MEYIITSLDIWDVVDRDFALERMNGRKPIPVRWVDINKGSEADKEYRSRLVVMETKFRSTIAPEDKGEGGGPLKTKQFSSLSHLIISNKYRIIYVLEPILIMPCMKRSLWIVLFVTQLGRISVGKLPLKTKTLISKLPLAGHRLDNQKENKIKWLRHANTQIAWMLHHWS